MSFIKKIILSLSLLVSSNSVASWFRSEPKKPDIKLFFKDPALVELTEAAVQNNLTRVKELLAKQKLDLNFPGYLWATPMHFAMVWSTPEIVVEFFKHGADPLAMAYSHGTPMGNLLTSTNNNLDMKIEKLKNLHRAGFDFKTADFLNEYRYLQSVAPRDVENKLSEYLFNLGLKDFLTEKKRGSPTEVRFYLEDGRGKKYPILPGTKLAMQITVHLAGEKAATENKLDDYFQQALRNLKAIKTTWHQTPIELKKDSDYLSSVKVTGDATKKVLLFDAIKAFPEWEKFFQGKDSDTVLFISSRLQTTWEDKKVSVVYSENGTESPVFERDPTARKAFLPED